MIEHFELKIERKKGKKRFRRFSLHEFFSNNVAKFWGEEFRGGRRRKRCTVNDNSLITRRYAFMPVNRIIERQ